MNRRYVLKNKRRFSLFIMIIAVLVMIPVFTPTVNGADEEEPYDTVIIQQGDTLWDLAKRYGGSNDIRKYIEKVKSINDMNGSSIYEGETLKMPL